MRVTLTGPALTGPRPLTLKQQRFVAEHLKDLNATQAAIRAGYSEKMPNEQGARLLAKASVGEAVAEAQARQLVSAGLTAVDTKEAIRRQVCGDVRRLFDEHGGLPGAACHRGHRTRFIRPPRPH